ncbi:putative sodium-dependent multivitamin transporter [Trichonephila clavipes]|nr:putative sodium-dependent multivitamin transporter [Trichonephila clavipes]
MLVLSTSIGVYYHFSDRKKSHKEYFLTNRNMPVATVSFSLMVSLRSASSYLGVPAENYLYGTQYVMLNLGYALGTPVAAFIFLPVFYKMQGASAFEYLEKRFDRAVRLLASSVSILQMGGMRAVLWTDLFQALIMLSAAFAICVKGTLDVGGLSEVWRIAEEGHRIQFFDKAVCTPSHDKTRALFSVDQQRVIRYHTCLLLIRRKEKSKFLCGRWVELSW